MFNDLEIRHLRFVRKIHECGTLTRAAGDLGITQSGLSQQLLLLEDRVGRSLFERTGRRMIPTEVGHRFLEHADSVLRELAVMEAYFRRLDVAHTGTLRISPDSLLCFPWLPGAMQRFREVYPGVGIQLRGERNLLSAIARKRLDIGLTFPREVPPELEVVSLFDDEMLAVLPPQHPLTTKKLISVKDFEGADFLYHMELEGSVLQQRYLGPSGIRLGSFTLIEQPEAIVALVQAGLGVTLLPKWSVARQADAGEVVTRRLRAREREFRVRWAAVIRRGEDTSFVSEFLDLVRAEAAARPR
jgi:LysR family transcriptional regulator for metE and metH